MAASSFPEFWLICLTTYGWWLISLPIVLLEEEVGFEEGYVQAGEVGQID